MADRKFLFTYRFNTEEYGLDIVASSPEEAKAKVRVLSLARYDGEIFATIHVPTGGLILRLVKALKDRHNG